jgi:hypothetical protein
VHSLYARFFVPGIEKKTQTWNNAIIYTYTYYVYIYICIYVYIIHISENPLGNGHRRVCVCVYVHHAHHLKVVIKDLQNGLREVYHKMFEDKIVDVCP